MIYILSCDNTYMKSLLYADSLIFNKDIIIIIIYSYWEQERKRKCTSERWRKNTNKMTCAQKAQHYTVMPNSGDAFHRVRAHKYKQIVTSVWVTLLTKLY